MRTISREASSGTPLSRSVPRVRLKRATAILRFMGPTTGSCSRMRSSRVRPFSVWDRKYFSAMKAAISPPAITHQKVSRKRLTPIRMTVMSGRVWCISSKIFVTLGTTKVMRKNRTTLPMRNMNRG